VERGLFETRTKAQAALLAGQVRVEGRPRPKAGDLVLSDVQVEVLAGLPYVGRGGLKLEAGLSAFRVDPRGRTCLDVGASTGGFTDCLLQRGARRVYAVDVGRGQLDAKLRRDPRVTVMERTNARGLSPSMFPDPPDLAVLDLAFISLRLVLPPVLACLKAPFDVVALIKPQFELSPRDTPKGVVRDEAARRRAVEGLLAFARESWPALASGEVVPSPIQGAKGNREFLWRLRGP